MSAKKPLCNQYDREGGIRFQIVERELSDFFACMTEHLPRVELTRQRSGLSKRLLVERDNVSSEVLVSLRTSEMGSAGMVKAMKADQLKLGILAFRAIMKNNGGVSQDVLYGMHRDIYSSRFRGT